MPTWLLLGLLAPVLFASVNCLEKVIVDRSRTSVYHYIAWVGVYDGLIGLVVLGAASGQGIDGRAYFGGWLAGTMVSVSLVLYLIALRIGQVARVIPIWYLNPLIVVPMAAVFLDERISILAVVALVLAVMGGVLVSWQGGKDSRSFGDPLPILLALVAAVFMAVSIVVAKEFLESGTFWQFFGTFRLGVATIMLWAFALPDVRGEFGMVLRSRRFMGMVIAAELLVSVSLILRNGAINLGPVSLVAAVSSIQPTMVFLYSLALATFVPSRFGHWIAFKTIKPQVAGIGAITAGVVIISLQ